MKEHKGLIGLAASLGGSVESTLHLLSGVLHALILFGTLLVTGLTALYYALKIRQMLKKDGPPKWLKWFLRLFILISALFAATAAIAQGVGDLPQQGRPLTPALSPDGGEGVKMLPVWHGLTLWHALYGVIAAWVTHANWGRLQAGFLLIQNYCDSRQWGLLPLAWRCLFGSPTPTARLREAISSVSGQQTKNTNEAQK